MPQQTNAKANGQWPCKETVAKTTSTSVAVTLINHGLRFFFRHGVEEGARNVTREGFNIVLSPN
jgi:hypothetical protein